MKERQAFVILFLAPVIWGITFSFQSEVSGVLGTFTFNGIRTLIGFIVLLPILIKILGKHDKIYLAKLIKGGFLCGICLVTASAFQQFGIATSSAGKAGFITSLYTLFVPILSVFIGKKVPRKIWLCVLIAIIGAYMLCITGKDGITGGDLLILVCALCFAVHILVIDKVGKDLEGIDLSAVQFLFAGAINMVIAVFTETISFEAIKDSAFAIFYSGALSCGVGYTLQMVGQKYVAPTKATLVLSLESVFAAIGGALILKETMNIKQIIGCALVFTAVVLSQIEFDNHKKIK